MREEADLHEQTALLPKHISIPFPFFGAVEFSLLFFPVLSNPLVVSTAENDDNALLSVSSLSIGSEMNEHRLVFLSYSLSQMIQQPILYEALRDFSGLNSAF